MKYFREFETADELSAWQSSSEYAKPNVVLADGVVYYNTPRYGVFIQHVNGTLYDEAGWTNGGFSNDVANGVAVITAKASFVIAKNDLGKMVGSSNTSTLVDGILTSTDSAIAANDFAGYDNTQLMLATDVSGAGYSCANFVFPNGDKGYLPAFGELEEALLKKSKINSVMVLIGGEGFAIGTYWSSTQQDRLNSWVLNSINGGAGISSKNGTVNVRAFSRL